MAYGKVETSIPQLLNVLNCHDESEDVTQTGDGKFLYQD
jgi:hypothetical protein